MRLASTLNLVSGGFVVKSSLVPRPRGRRKTGFYTLSVYKAK